MTATTLTDLLPSLGMFAGTGGVGALIGYTVRKLVKLLTIVVGIILTPVFAFLAYCTYRGWITVNWTALYDGITSGVMWLAQGALSLVQSVSLAVPAVGGLAAGFAIGFNAAG